MSVGFWQIAIILGMIFLLFGARRLPSIMEDLAKGIKAFKKGLGEGDLAEIKHPLTAESQEEQKIISIHQKKSPAIRAKTSSAKKNLNLSRHAKKKA